jgi:hypothetical protein
MPRFFFHVRFDHHNRSRNELGLDFIEVENVSGELVFRLPFSELFDA